MHTRGSNTIPVTSHHPAQGLILMTTLLGVVMACPGGSLRAEEKPAEPPPAPTAAVKLDGFSIEELRALQKQVREEIARRTAKDKAENPKIKQVVKAKEETQRVETETNEVKKEEAGETAGKKKDWLSGVWDAVSGSEKQGDAVEVIADAALSNEDVRKGLCEALSQGIRSAIASLGKEDGYFKSEDVKVLLPKGFADVEKGVRVLGQGQRIDELILTMNRAAEKAVPEVTDIFAKALSEMSIADAKVILKGKDTEATEYFKKSSRVELAQKIRPIVSEMTKKAGTSKAYKDFMNKIGPLKSMLKDVVFDLDDHVTEKALDGLFLMIGREEKRIRENPAARTTDILRKVFGVK